ncbi:endonuclease [Helicobacter muridarum]|uniref:Endonuclease n=1 Tax=Helicobacter muridarum TaxID=216 RepID=A0A099TWL8_9HELI|nr:BsaWI family type II restriction enzyme [Helicobacter muridarum]TLE01078.1 endonuclease [Helicobacter muridarum]STQ85938.1 endonuclease MjaVIP [Helicobacter muridarum]
MKPYEKIAQDFRAFLLEYGDEAYSNLKDFFTTQKEQFYSAKISELKAQGFSEQEAINKARQGWVSVIGRGLEFVIEILEFCKKYHLKTTNDKILRSKNLNAELDSIKRMLLVHFGDYSVLPDGDIIIYRVENALPKILAILSVKNSFRERYTETPYWKLKLLETEATRHIKVFMITPDNDDEISFSQNSKKSRIVMEYELDGIYLAKSAFDKSDKVKGIESLLIDLRKLL